MDFLPPDHPLRLALAERNYTTLTPVQSAVMEADLDRDLLVSAQTGSGKTVAYGLAMADNLLGAAKLLPPAADPLALIVAPTRELALQVHGELTWLYKEAGAQVVSCVGGMDPRSEQRILGRGAHIVVGTPGRLRDHLERGGLRVGQLRTLVLDEADEMLDLGFREDLEFILQTTPSSRRTLLFSATLPKPIVALAKSYQRDAVRIAVTGAEKGHVDIEFRALRVAPNEIEHAVVNMLRFVDSPTSMIFCNTRDSVRHLHAILQERGFSVVALSGELSQNERNTALQSLRDGRSKVCVATDVAARGIDLPNLGLVIHAELPQSAQTFLHRSGRTGRAGRKGISAIVVPLSRRRRADGLLAAAGVTARWSGAPTAEDIRALDEQRLLQDPILAETASEEELAMAAKLLTQTSAEQLAAALVRLYRSHLPAAEELFDPGADAPAPRLRDQSSPRERGAASEHKRSKFERGNADSVWFRLPLGRLKNADPRWLLPMICRMGTITKQDIGAIRIFERDTKFEILGHAAAKFSANLAALEKPEFRVEKLTEEPPEAEPHPKPWQNKPVKHKIQRK